MSGEMLGRERELAAARETILAAASGRGAVLVVLGEPGIGKTTLIEAAAESDPDARVIRVTGVQAERQVPFATLQALLWPLRDRLGELDRGQADLLRGILQLGPAVEGSAFAIGAATLALLSESSRERLLVVVVDDAHWSDAASEEVLAFVGRRLGNERVALVAGVREHEVSLLAEEASFARVRLAGLSDDAARSVLEHASATPLPRSVAAWLMTMCAGNPLGLVELPRLLTEPQRRGEHPLPASLDVGPLVQRAFIDRVERLPLATRDVLLLLAAAGPADRGLLERAGAERSAVDEAEEIALAERDGRLEFRHPLLRAAVYASAAPAERRRAHRLLAGAVAGVRRTWHLAEAAEGVDESVAEALEAAAETARLAGGRAVEAETLERSAALTADDDRRARRLCAAAQAWVRAGRLDHAQTLLEQALLLARDRRTRAEIQLERGGMLVRGHEMDAAYDLLLAEADRIAPVEPKLAARMLVQAETALELERLDTRGAVALAERACSLAGRDGDSAELETINSLVVARMTTGAPPGAEDLALVARAAELLEQAELRAGSEEAHWISYCLALHERDDEARQLSDRCLADARAAGDVWNLCYALAARAALEQATGRIDAARAWASEALPLADQIGEPYRICESYAVMSEVESARGSLDDCRRAHETSVAHQWAGAPVPAETGFVLGLVFLARGRFEDAVEQLETAVSYVGRVAVSRAWYQLIPVELAESYARVGRRRDAEKVLREVAAGIDAAPLLRPRAKLARVRGLLAPEARIDQAFTAALALLEEVPQHLERARTEHCWGERLLRAGRSSDATVHLEHALARYEALGAVGWAERTRGELADATGTERPVQPRQTDVLTAQELRVAGHAASGMRDRDIAALLYLSPRTVESYLQQSYRKLGVSNRTQLAGVLAADGVRPTETPIPVPQDP